MKRTCKTCGAKKDKSDMKRLGFMRWECKAHAIPILYGHSFVGSATPRRAPEEYPRKAVHSPVERRPEEQSSEFGSAAEILGMTLASAFDNIDTTPDVSTPDVSTPDSFEAGGGSFGGAGAGGDY